MDEQDYPIRHFQEMTSLARTLKAVPAQVLAYNYSYESFGSLLGNVDRIDNSSIRRSEAW